MMLEAPPRRLDIEEHGYRAGTGLRVFLNGEPVSRVLAYDIDAGFVRRIAVDERGFVRVERGEVVEEELRGKVQVGWKSSCRR